MRLCDVVFLPRVVVGHGVNVRRWLDRMMSRDTMIRNGRLPSTLYTQLILDERIFKRNL
jgi:hypothetical protein